MLLEHNVADSRRDEIADNYIKICDRTKGRQIEIFIED